ncbi:SseB family protein [Campylobacter curvus]|uniref:SseB family protein n=1 Tax=Campylobacter curvus TaxID=200 RepID=UPI0014708509|nr:SseB family protein [Campylobacter curvus]
MSLKDMMEKFISKPCEVNEKALLKELKKAEFLTPVIMAAPLAKPDGGAVYEEEGSNIKFVLLEDESDKKSYFPAFTSREEMMKWRNDSEQEVLNLRLKDYAAMLASSHDKYAGVVIDAFSHSFILDITKLEAIFGKEI